jgi:Tfp pilus assembly protein PilN
VSISLHVPKPKTAASILEEQRVVEERGAKAALLKSHTQAFLRLLPKGGQLSNLTWQGDGLLAEVRLSKDQTVDSFALAVHISEHFTEASIRSVKDNASGGRTVQLTFRAR